MNIEEKNPKGSSDIEIDEDDQWWLLAIMQDFLNKKVSENWCFIRRRSKTLLVFKKINEYGRFLALEAI